MNGDDNVDVLVVGGGPAGVAAALVLARARRKVLVVDDGTYRNRQVEEFHGFPGRDATDPASFRQDVWVELARYGVNKDSQAVKTVATVPDGLEIVLADDHRLAARAAVLATGVADELPAVDGLAERWGRSAFNCPFCDGWEHRDRPVVVLDAAPGADDLARMLRQWTARVEMVRADDVARLVGEGTGLEAIETTDGALIPADAVFVKAPVRPRTALAAALDCRLDEADYVVTNGSGATSHDRLWAAGDVRRPPPMPHQVVLAAADGASAAISIHKSLMDRIYR